MQMRWGQAHFFRISQGAFFCPSAGTQLGALGCTFANSSLLIPSLDKVQIPPPVTHIRGEGNLSAAFFVTRRQSEAIRLLFFSLTTLYPYLHRYPLNHSMIYHDRVRGF